jgi:hypothetical protein
MALKQWYPKGETSVQEPTISPVWIPFHHQYVYPDCNRCDGTGEYTTYYGGDNHSHSCWRCRNRYELATGLDPYVPVGDDIPLDIPPDLW